MRGRQWRSSEFGLARVVNNPGMRQRLGITDEQAAKIRQQTSEFRKAQIRSRADLQVKRLELSELLAASTPDRAAIDRKLEEISAAQLAERKSEVNYRLTMRNALTSEQRQKLEQMRGEFRQRGPAGRRWQRGGEPTPLPKPQGE
jgi:Spy/CpxP family protein refolding chaperone